jgi:hypothetical protein
MNKMKIYFLLAIAFTLSTCTNGSKTNGKENIGTEEAIKSASHFVEFEIENQKVFIGGKSDIRSEFYTKKWPDYHTNETVKKTRMEHRNIFCGRISNDDYSEMVEIFFNYPENTLLTVDSLRKEANQKRFTFNFDSKTSKPIDNNFRLYYYNTLNEYTSDSESRGYVQIEKINGATDSTITAEGFFDLNVREYGKSELKKVKGKFNLEFYIGI